MATLFERLGGPPGLARISAELYERASADPELGSCLHVSHRQFSLLAAHLADVLDSLDVGPEEADEVLGWVARNRQVVVAEADVGFSHAAPVRHRHQRGS